MVKKTQDETDIRPDAQSLAHIEAALVRLRETIAVPPIDPARERALLARFDAHHAPGRGSVGWVSAAAAALMIATVGLNWLVITSAPRIVPAASEPAIDMAGFVAWPGADVFPRFESGSLVRVDLPVSALPALGLTAPFSAVSVVQADIVVGQDGFARAVRLVQ